MEDIKRIAVINDLSGIGGCSLTAAIPILSCIGVQCCPFPTAILSNQTNYDEYYFKDFTSEMREYKAGLNKLDIKFQGIYTGFLGSKDQIDIVLEFINEHKEALIVVDPVMGDEGKKYDTFDSEMCSKMKDLVRVAHIITPNLTEACLLTKKDYYNMDINEDNIKALCLELIELGPKKVVITGIHRGDKIYNYGYDSLCEDFIITESKYNNTYYSGTGDIFSSIISGYSMRGINFKMAIEKASNFIEKAISYTSNFKRNTNEGIIFEPLLRELIKDDK